MPRAAGDSAADAARRCGREHVFEVWRLARSGATVGGEGRNLAKALLDHPEFYPFWDRLPVVGEKDMRGLDMNPVLHALVHQVVENQLEAGDPPAVTETLERLQRRGFSRHRAIHLIAHLLAAEIHEVIRAGRPADVGAYERRVRSLALAAEGRLSMRGVGRNDPCPCGSGKKFKKCCAADPLPDVSAPDAGKMILGARNASYDYLAELPEDHPLIYLENVTWVASALAQLGDPVGALQAHRAAVDVARREMDGKWLSNALQDLLFFAENEVGMEEEAIAAARELAAIARDPADADLYRIDVGDLLMRMGRREEGERIYREVMEGTAAHGWAPLQWARHMVDAGRLDEAEAAYRRVLAMGETAHADARACASQELGELRRRAPEAGER